MVIEQQKGKALAPHWLLVSILSQVALSPLEALQHQCVALMCWFEKKWAKCADRQWALRGTEQKTGCLQPLGTRRSRWVETVTSDKEVAGVWPEAQVSMLREYPGCQPA